MQTSPDTLHAPHPPLTEYYQREEERRAYVLGLFSRTAADYERIETLLSWGSGAWYRRQALLRSGLAPGMRVIDVGVGTGLVARAACAIVGDPRCVTGVDPCASMLAHARVPAGVQLLEGSAEALPAAANSADFISMGYALRHVGDVPNVFREFHRVLKPGGTLCLLEISAPRSAAARALLKLYLRGFIPVAATVLARHRDMGLLMRYYWDTMEACIAPETILAALTNAGFIRVKRHVELGVFSEYSAVKPPDPNTNQQP